MFDRRNFLWNMLRTLLMLCGAGYSCSQAVAQPNPASVIRRVAFGSCAAQDKPQPIWKTIATATPDLFLFIGDNIYADTEDMEEMAQKYKLLGSKPQFARFRSKVPVLATWDDHDYGINDGGLEYPKKEESKKLMLDFFCEPLDSERRQRPGLYTSYYFGPPGSCLQLILLDLRWFRTPLNVDPTTSYYLPNEDPDATILGAAQWQWLECELKKSADLRIIASSTQFSSADHRWEKWANYPKDKARMIDMLDKLQIENAIFVSGDMHYGELSAEQTPRGFPIFDLTSSGMNLFESAAPYRNRHRISVWDASANFGFIEIDWGKTAIVASLQVRSIDGKTRIRRDVTFSKRG